MPIYVQEKIHPKAIIDDLRRVAKEGIETRRSAICSTTSTACPTPRPSTEFYHSRRQLVEPDDPWRLAPGDDSLAEKEGLRGQGQMIYMDPPYGISFASNWQASTKRRDVKDGKVSTIDS